MNVSTLKRINIGIVAGILYLVFSIVPSARADDGSLKNLTLKSAYHLALERSETIAIGNEVLQEAEARFQQSLSTILPQAYFLDSERRQDGPRSSDSTSTRRYVPQRQFTFTQPLFSGFKEFAAMAASKAERRQREQELLRAKQLLLIDVSDAFYLLRNYQENLTTVEEIHKALEDRMAELKKREGLGRSRTSEVASTEARLYQSEANIEAVRSQQDVARQLLEFLVGKRVASLSGEDQVIDLSSQAADAGRAEARADVRAAKEALAVAQKEIAIARAGYSPTVNVEGNYYTKRLGASSDVDWDATLNVSVPIFTGGLTTGLVREARARAEEARLNLSRVKRQAVFDIESAFTQLTADVRQTAAYQKAAEASQKNYQLQIEDYRRSQVNNLDVLQALEDLQDVRQNYIAIKSETQRAYWRMKVAQGGTIDDAF